MNRENVIVGPAKYVLQVGAGTASFYSQDDVTVNIDTTLVDTRIAGMLEDQNITDAIVRLSVKPDGHLDANIIAGFWPYLSAVPGTGVAGAADKTLIAHDTNSHKHTIYCAVVSKMPDLHLGLEDTIIQPVEFVGMRKTAITAWSADSLYKGEITGGAFAWAVGDGTWDPPHRQEYTAVWTAKTGFTAFTSVTGFRVRFNTQISWHQLPAIGTFQGTLQSIDVAVECEPVEASVTEALEAMAVSSASAKRGASMASVSALLTITGVAIPGVVFTLPKAQLYKGSYRFGTGTNFLRNGQFAFVGTRNRTAGILDALCTIAHA